MKVSVLLSSYGDLAKSLKIKELATESACIQAIRLVDASIIGQLSYAKSCADLLANDGKIHALNQYGEDGLPRIQDMLINAFGCSEKEELGVILTERLRILTRSLHVKCPDSVDELFIDVEYTPRFKKSLPEVSESI